MTLEKFEYKAITPYSNIAEVLNEYAKEDWEFVCLVKVEEGKEKILLRRYIGFKSR